MLLEMGQWAPESDGDVWHISLCVWSVSSDAWKHTHCYSGAVVTSISKERLVKTKRSPSFKASEHR